MRKMLRFDCLRIHLVGNTRRRKILTCLVLFFTTNDLAAIYERFRIWRIVRGTQKESHLNSDEKIFGFGAWTRRRFVQMSAASAVSASLGNLAHAQASGSASMIDVPFEKRNPRIAMIGT